MLDLLGLHYNADMIQGESLLKDSFKRRYIFAYGSENTVTSISSAGYKVHASFKTGDIWAYNLSSDPGEKNRLGIDLNNEQLKTLVTFRDFQKRLLPVFNTR